MYSVSAKGRRELAIIERQNKFIRETYDYLEEIDDIKEFSDFDFEEVKQQIHHTKIDNPVEDNLNDKAKSNFESMFGPTKVPDMDIKPTKNTFKTQIRNSQQHTGKETPSEPSDLEEYDPKVDTPPKNKKYNQVEHKSNSKQLAKMDEKTLAKMDIKNMSNSTNLFDQSINAKNSEDFSLKNNFINIEKADE